MRRNPGLVVAALLTCAALAGCGTTIPSVGAQGGLGSSPVDTGPSVARSAGTSTSGTVAGGAPGAAGSAGANAPGSIATTPTGSAGNATMGIPLKGPGWDAKNVYVGVPTADDFNTVVANLGANFSNGDVHGDVDAVVAAINSSGGVLGRKLVAVYHDASTVELSSNPASVAQAMCSYFTQDRPVVAVINGAPQLDAQESFHRCLEQKQTTLLSFSNTDYSDKDYARLGPHLFTVASLSTDIIVPTFVAALHRQRFFSGWDTTLGAPKATPAKVGLLLPESSQGHHVGDLLRANLKRIGVAVVSDFFYDPAGSGGQSQAEVLRFASANVTHVLDLPPVAAEIYFFQRAAEQHYRPRYGFTSFNLPLSTEENSAIAPPVQQVGSMGIGWQPLNDVNAAHDPGTMPGGKRCFSALQRGDQTFTSSERRAAFIAVQFCDGLFLLRDAMVTGRGFTGADLLRAMPIVGPRFSPAATFRSALANDNHGVPGYYVDEVYNKQCSCFTYVGGKRPFSRAR